MDRKERVILSLAVTLVIAMFLVPSFIVEKKVEKEPQLVYPVEARTKDGVMLLLYVSSIAEKGHEKLYYEVKRSFEQDVIRGFLATELYTPDLTKLLIDINRFLAKEKCDCRIESIFAPELVSHP